MSQAYIYIKIVIKSKFVRVRWSKKDETTELPHLSPGGSPQPVDISPTRGNKKLVGLDQMSF